MSALRAAAQSWYDTAIALLRDLPNPVAVLNPSTLQILDVNASASRLFGYSRDEFLRMTLYDMTPPEDHDEIARRAQSFGSEKSQYFGPARHLAKDGRIVLVENVAIPAVRDGMLVGINIATDVTERVHAQERSRSIFDNFPLPMWVYDPLTLRFLDANRAAAQTYGYSREEFLGMHITALATPGAREKFEQINVREAGHLCDVYSHVRKDGSVIMVEVESDTIPFGGNETARIVVAKDVTEKVALEAQADAARRRLEEAQEIAHLGSFEHNFKTRHLYLSAEAMRIMGLTPESAPRFEADLLRWFHPDDHAAINDAIRNAWPAGEYTVETRLVRADGQIRWVSVRAKGTYFANSRRPLTVTGTMLDVTDRKAAERELRFLAFHDPLTLLPNRASVPALLERAIDRGPFAVFYIDFDGFSEVNDSFGHGFGDAVLRMIADRLTKAIGRDASVTRWGGDEFVVIVPVSDDAADRHAAALEAFQTVLAPAYEVGGRELFIGASIGIARYPQHGTTSEELIRNADTAMYDAKRHRNASAVFHPSMYDAAKRRLEIQNGLHQALRTAQFRLFFQPVISTDGSIVSAEALIRWDDPLHGLRLPGEFIETAEESGLIVDIGEWVVNEACRTIGLLHAAGLDVPIAVNVSTKEVEFGHVLDCVNAALARNNVPASSLIVEITETGVMRDVSRSSRVLETLRSRGIKIALDDFGTGYSSLGHLKSLPIDALKVDRALLRDVETAGQDREIASAIVRLAAATNVTAIAEGVEAAPQHDVLRALGYDAFQGYFFSPPLPFDEFLSYARSRIF